MKKIPGSVYIAILIIILFVIRFYIATPKSNVIKVSDGNWQKLSLILKQIDRHYVDSVDYSSVIEKTLPILLENLDPHSVYFPPQDLAKAEEALEGDFDGIGIQFNVPEDTAIVISVITGGPSERAGLLSGDRIMKIDGRDIAGNKTPQDTMVKYMRGPSGTKVLLEILRKGDDNLVPFIITRDKIPQKSIDVAYMMNDTTGYIKLSKFSKSSYKEFMEDVIPMINNGMTKLIFDLRDNTGGYLDQALLLSNEFLHAKDLIVFMEGRHRPRQDFHADGRGKCQDIELAVLINENSASSSEILAGAIQDNDRGLIYGRRSYGKGLVQEPFYLSDKSGLRLTVARFYTPTGRSIQRPYNGDENYRDDIYERYRHGEMMDADSIRKNDSLKYETPGGRIVYGGGGITPDVFVPIDTVGVTRFLISLNRQSLQVKYSIAKADQYRIQLREIKDLASLNKLLDSMNLEQDFLAYAKRADLIPERGEWAQNKDIILTQLRAYIGRYSALDDNAFYPIISILDNVIQAAL